ncbi:DUF3343 domain-containing protein [Paenibacillus marinisediminis]
MIGEPAWLVMAFDSTQQALRAEMLLEYADLEIDTCPTPKAITAGCALSIRFEEEHLEQVKEIILSEQVVIRGIFRPINESKVTYTCIWSSAGGE